MILPRAAGNGGWGRSRKKLDLGGGDVGDVGPGYGDDGAEVEQLLGVAPARKLSDGVHAEHKVEVGAAAQILAQLDEGIDGVGEAGAVYLDGGYFEAGAVLDREAGHGEPMLGRGDLLVGLEPGPAGRDQYDVVEGEAVKGGLGNGEMAEVYGVEGTAEDADFEYRCIRVHDHMVSDTTDTGALHRAKRTETTNRRE